MNIELRAQCVAYIIRLGPWRDSAHNPEERARRTARIQSVMGATKLAYVSDIRLKAVRDALHALTVEVGA